MESTARKATEAQYEYRHMTVGEYMLYCSTPEGGNQKIVESTVYKRVEAIKKGKIPTHVLDFEQLAPGYPITMIVRCRIRKSMVN